MSDPREIKFRAWDKNQKRMGFLDLSSSDFGDPSWLNAGVLMQYTGLKDKNGVEIYELDIIKCVGERYTVDWHFNRWVWRDSKGKLNEFQHLNFKAGWYEVIGNVWENKDLLK